jgi:hypothetical protein
MFRQRMTTCANWWHASMLAIDREAEKIRQRDRLIHKLYLLVITLSSVIILLAAMIFAMTHSAAAGGVCLSKKEARQLWPKRHIYWYSKKHCWSNRRGPPRNLRIDPIINSHAQDKSEAPAKAQDQSEDHCCWPDLERDANGQIIEPPRAWSDRWNDQPWIGRIIGE